MDDEPRWQNIGLAIEFWVLTLICGYAFCLGIFGAITELLRAL